MCLAKKPQFTDFLPLYDLYANRRTNAHMNSILEEVQHRRHRLRHTKDQVRQDLMAPVGLVQFQKVSLCRNGTMSFAKLMLSPSMPWRQSGQVTVHMN